MNWFTKNLRDKPQTNKNGREIVCFVINIYQAW